MNIEQIAQSNIFFFVTTIAVVVISILLVVVLVQVIRILRTVQEVGKTLQTEGKGMVDDFNALRNAIKEKGKSFVGLSTLAGLAALLKSKTKTKTKNKKTDKA